MADFISDPSVAAAIDDLKRRWPAIGEAADHPLTEWFIRRKNQKHDWSHDRFVVMRALVYIGVCASLYWLLPRPFKGFAYLVGGLMAWIERLLAKPQKQCNVRNLRHLLVREGDPGQLEQLWLVPLRYRDLAGIHIGCQYHKLFDVRRRRAGKLFLWLTLLFIVWVLHSILIASSASLPNIIAAWCCMAVLGAALYRSITDPAYVLHSALRQIKVDALPIKSIFREDMLGPRNSYYVAFLILAFGIAFFLLLVPPAYWFILDITLLVPGFGIYLWNFVWHTRNLEAAFDEFVQIESARYDEFVRRLMRGA